MPLVLIDELTSDGKGAVYSGGANVITALTIVRKGILILSVPNREKPVSYTHLTLPTKA